MFTILEREWKEGNNTDFHRLKCLLGVHDIQSEIKFYLALEWLVESRKILLELCQKEFYVIISYPTNTAKNNISKL